MKEVDARGLSCPEPLMLTAEALKNADGACEGAGVRAPSEDECGEICEGPREEGDFRGKRRML